MQHEEDNVKEEPTIRGSLPVHDGVEHANIMPRSLRIDGLVLQ